MGFNYIGHGNIDEHHKAFPHQPAIGTEESTSQATRGVYFTDEARGHMAPSNRQEKGSDIEFGLRYYAKRPFLAGLFFWTGFDYRGEPNPFGYPAISSQFGILDTCGFAKDSYDYLKSWWREEAMLHIAPHWTWPGREGEKLQLWVYANGDEVELWVNGQSQGRKKMEALSHVQWEATYQPGEITARSYRQGKEIASQTHRTASVPASLVLEADRNEISADGADLAAVAVSALDAKSQAVPTASNEITFSVDGPGKIIGVGNGDPSSHEPGRYFDQYQSLTIHNLKMAEVGKQPPIKMASPSTDTTAWEKFKTGPFIPEEHEKIQPQIMVRGEFDLSGVSSTASVTLMAKEIAGEQRIFVNGVELTITAGTGFAVDSSLLTAGINTFAVSGSKRVPKFLWDNVNTDPGTFRVVTPALDWRCRVFNGLAQVLVQSTGGPGPIILTAKAKDMPPLKIQIGAKTAAAIPFVPSENPF
jgi:beta-galactosidase